MARRFSGEPALLWFSAPAISSVMNPLASAVLISWRRNAAYGERLAADLLAERFIAQPHALAPGVRLNHPAWVFSHLNLYAAVAVCLCRGETFDDPADHRYGQRSDPLNDPGAYETKDALLAAWRDLHAAGEAALLSATPERTSGGNPVERWRTLHPTVGDMLVTLMVKHEAAHLGQLSAWRRAMGLPRVAM